MNNSEKEIIKHIHLLAFAEDEGEEEGKAIAQLAAAFLEHPDTISISAERDGKMAGNVLFTPFYFKDHPDKKCYLLAPLGVLPEFKGQGVGTEVVQKGIEYLKSIGTDAVFVLGIPTFYPLLGFVPTDINTPYPELLTEPPAWMALEITSGITQKLSGSTSGIDAFMKPEFWDTSGRG